MKRVIITGKDSYIGNHIQDWLEQYEGEYRVEQIDVRTDSWKEYKFNGVDTIVHVAGIVHHPEIIDENLYYSVNKELPIEIATVAKRYGVKQFVFFSTMGVYGEEKSLPKTNYIFLNSLCNANDLYGISKLEAEKELKKLEDENFTISIIRPPNVYGAHCKGRYISGFTKIVKIFHIIPSAYTDVYQSMIYIDNLCEMVKLLIEQNRSGIFLPQDAYDISTEVLISYISLALNKKIIFSKFLGALLKVFEKSSIVTKVYGGIAYEKDSSIYDNLNYNVVPFEEAIIKTIKEDQE